MKDISDQIVHACSLDNEQLAARRDEWRSVGAGALIDSRSGPEGYTATYRSDDATVRALQALVAAERECCPEFEWRLEREDDVIRLEVSYAAVSGEG